MNPEKKRKIIIQWLFLPIFFIVVFLGRTYPLLGLIVLGVMFSGIVTSYFFKGRYMCRNFCPRGSFLDRLLSKISAKKKIPKFFTSKKFRWIILFAVMGLFMYKILLNPTDLNYIGKIFWEMCLITSTIAIILGLLIHERTWCSFCPMGTLQSTIGKKRKKLDKTRTSKDKH